MLSEWEPYKRRRPRNFLRTTSQGCGVLKNPGQGLSPMSVYKSPVVFVRNCQTQTYDEDFYAIENMYSDEFYNIDHYS